MPYLVLISAMLILLFDIFKAGSTIFSKKGYDLICSFPLHTTSIVVARFLGMYISNLFLTALIILPGTCVYGIMVKPGPGFYLALLMGALFIPVLPMVIATMIGTVIYGISSRMKNSALWEIILTVGFVVLTLGFSFTLGSAAEDMSMEMIFEMVGRIGVIIGSIYPPAIWLQQATIYGKWLYLLLFLGVALAAFTLMIALVVGNFHKICKGLFATTASHDYKMETLKQESMLFSLYKRDMKRYLASGIYVTNTIVGPIMGLLMAVALALIDMDAILAEFPPMSFSLEGLVPFVVAGTFTMMTATCVSISMEGKEIWILKTLPIPVKSMWDSKILVNLSFIAPFYVISEGLLIYALRPGILEALWLIFIPAAMIIFCLVLGITVDLHFHSFDWEKEETVVKQSASAGFGGFAGMFFSLGGGVVFALCPPEYQNLGNGVILVVLIVLTWILYNKNNKVKIETL